MVLRTNPETVSKKNLYVIWVKNTNVITVVVSLCHLIYSCSSTAVHLSDTMLVISVLIHILWLYFHVCFHVPFLFLGFVLQLKITHLQIKIRNQKHKEARFTWRKLLLLLVSVKQFLFLTYFVNLNKVFLHLQNFYFRKSLKVVPTINILKCAHTIWFVFIMSIYHYHNVFS